MKILVTGHLGYVGPAVLRQLRRAHPDAVLEGFDTGYFAHCLSGSHRAPEGLLDRQHVGDIRDVPDAVLSGVDAIVHLAAISNDPIGARFATVTEDVNYKASVALAEKAARAGVANFVFASSCSVYGFAPGAARRESDELNPQTAYARSKVATERRLAEIDLGDMVVTALRFATACGWSDRLRLDLVLNDFVASAITTGKVVVLSDGSPWRPLIDIRDMALAIEWAATRSANQGGRVLAVNIGAMDGNYQVKQLAEAVAAAVPGTEVSINTEAAPDTRSYQVDFSLQKRLAPNHVPRVSLTQSIEMLRDNMSRIKGELTDFRTSSFMRLRELDHHLTERRLTDDLHWTKTETGW